jgi:hypothetical protein
VTSDSSETSPLGQRFNRFAGVFMLAVVVLINGLSLWKHGRWPADAPWSTITMTALGLNFLLARRDENRWSARFILSGILALVALVSAIMALVVLQRG